MILGAGFLGAGGFIAGAVISIAVLASTRTLTGGSYLYPLIPFDGKVLKRLIFRRKK